VGSTGDEQSRDDEMNVSFYPDVSCEKLVRAT